MGAAAILDHYFEGRGAEFPAAPRPLWQEVAGAVLAGGPSATGVDGLPYEIYHYGLHFCVSLLAQFQYAAAG
eukprot:13745255-Alexandrium_andersonii.AAC.1